MPSCHNCCTTTADIRSRAAGRITEIHAPETSLAGSRSPALATVSCQAGHDQADEEGQQHQPQPAVDGLAPRLGEQPHQRGHARMLGSAAARRCRRRTSATPAAGARSLRSRESAGAGRGGPRPAGPRPRPARRRGRRWPIEARDRHGRRRRGSVTGALTRGSPRATTSCPARAPRSPRAARRPAAGRGDRSRGWSCRS